MNEQDVSKSYDYGTNTEGTNGGLHYHEQPHARERAFETPYLTYKAAITDLSYTRGDAQCNDFASNGGRRALDQEVVVVVVLPYVFTRSLSTGDS